MPTNFRVSSLIPTGLIVDSVVQDGDAIIVTAHAGARRGEGSTDDHPQLERAESTAQPGAPIHVVSDVLLAAFQIFRHEAE